MFSLRGSVAARLVLGYGLVVSISVFAVSAAFYIATIGVLGRGLDAKIVSISNRLVAASKTDPIDDLYREINHQLSDGVDTDSEIFLVQSPAGERVAGNVASVINPLTPLNQLVDRDIVRNGRIVTARVIVRQLPNGARLFVGQDLRDQEAIRKLIWTALAIGAAISLFLAINGAIYFRRQIALRIGDIRRTALEIEAGDLTRRIVVTSDDEFGLLNRDINRMLNRIEQLMTGVQHVSNAIAHDLRTPLSRIRSKLEAALQSDADLPAMRATARGAIDDIDNLILIFEKLLQIAEAESGMRPQSFATVDVSRVVADIVDLYDATAEENRMILTAAGEPSVLAHGDRNLLGSALASLVDNAIKYAGPGAAIEVAAYREADWVCLVVRDDGPGISAEELPQVTKRFYRLDKSRHLPGNGLGLAIVSAVAVLHGGILHLEAGSPGLIATLRLPTGTPERGESRLT